MHVLFAASEVAPIAKIGGLGDVLGSLPIALDKLGVKASVVIPHYGVIDNEKWAVKQVSTESITYAGQPEAITISLSNLPNSNLEVILIGNDTYLRPGGVMAFEGSDAETNRFAFFSKAVYDWFSQPNLPDHLADISHIHVNDWHTALLPLVWKLGNPKTLPKFLLTIHNLAYQGIAKARVIQDLELPQGRLKGNEHGDINFLAEGIIFADRVNTVSASYAQEILTKQFGAGLDDLLLTHREKLSGILNGIDYNFWNPATDQFIANCYTNLIDQSRNAKASNKKNLQKKLSLPQVNQPIFSYVGRIEPNQKGLDILTEAIQRQSLGSCQFIILGKGEPKWEQQLARLADLDKGVSVTIAFDEGLAHLIYAGSDYILVPSKFEPCGLPQMIGQRYGTPPVVHAVGGLKDSVVEGKTGFVFKDYSTQALLEKIQQAIVIYNTDWYWQIAQNGMAQDFSWTESARKYKALYESL